MVVSGKETDTNDNDIYIDDASFHITGNVPPNAPTLTSPADNSYTNDSSPVFKWNFSDPNSGDTQSAYQWVADDDSGFGNIDYDSGKTVTSYSSHTATIAEGVWYWKVKTWDQDNLEGDYSSYRKLTIDLTPPSAVSDLSATGSGSNIELSWTPQTDSLSGVDHQIIYRATFTINPSNKGNATIVNNFISPGINSYTDTSVISGVTYYYVITSVDKATNESSLSNNAGPIYITSISEISETGTWYAVYFTADKTDSTYKPYFNKKLCELIMKAQSEVLLACYNLADDDPSGDTSGSVIDALNNRYSNGVTVEVIVDDDHSTEAALSNLNPGITVNWDASSDEMHNKFVIIDGEYIWTGSANFTQYNYSINDNLAVIIRDSSLASNYKQEFNEMWNGTFHAGTQTNGVYTIGGVEVRNYYGVEDEPVEGLTSALPGMRYYIQNANESVIGAAYTASGSLNDSYTDLVDDLDSARGKGCAVRIIYDKNQMQTGEAYTTLDAKGHNVRLKGGEDSIYDYMHNKFLVIDQDITITGSANWTHSSDDYNDENIIIVNDPIFSRIFVKYFLRMYSGTTDLDTAESPAPDETAPSPVLNVYAYSYNSGEIGIDFGSSSDSGFSRYFVFISSHPFKNKTVSDATDNDGDGAVDEEILNGVDDDGDGTIDEDNNLLPEKCIKTKGTGVTGILLTTYNQGDPLINNTTYYIAVVQTDKWGNESSFDFSDPNETDYNDDSYDSVVCGATPDQQPNCEIESPSSGWHSGIITLNATASDPDDSVEEVSFEYSTNGTNLTGLISVQILTRQLHHQVELTLTTGTPLQI